MTEVKCEAERRGKPKFCVPAFPSGLTLTLLSCSGVSCHIGDAAASTSSSRHSSGDSFSYLAASAGRSVLERSRTGVATGQSALQALGDVTFRYLMRTGIVASRSDS